MMIEYDFKTMTEKDVFTLKLKDTVPDFGYISSTARKDFIQFCIDNGIMSYIDKVKDQPLYGYRVLMEFSYTSMTHGKASGSYRASEVDCEIGQILVIDRAARPRSKHNRTFRGGKTTPPKDNVIHEPFKEYEK